MPKISSRPKSILIPGCLVIACLALVACTGGGYTSKVNGEKKASHVDEQRTRSLVNEPDLDGQTTIHNTQDTKTKRQVPARSMAEQLEGLSITPKRRRNDPIYVNLAPLILDSKTQQVEKSKGAIEQQILSEFAFDPIIKLVGGTRNSSGKWELRAAPSIADVEVSPKVSIKEVYVLQSQTGKPGKMSAVVFEATISSQVPPVTSTVSETGHVLQKVEVSKRFVTQIKQVILEKIGPGIPAH